MIVRPDTLHSKFLLGLSLATLVIGAVLAAGFYVHMRQVLEVEVSDKAELVFAQVDAVQSYVRGTLRPTMYNELPETFVIEAMSSSYISRAVMDKVRDSSGHLYRRVAVNARNPDFEANALERELIGHFRENDGKRLYQGYREIGGLEYFVMARPVRYKQSCMYCHGEPSDAPAALVEKYGERGFGHPVDSIGGLDFVGLPVSASVARVQEAIFTYLLVFTLAVLLFFASTNLVFKRVVVNNLRVLSSMFRKNLTDARGEELLREVERGDELDRMIQGMEQLGEHLYTTRSQLQDYAANLEHKVRERTRELEQEFSERQSDVQLFVRLLAGLNRSQTRPQLWREAVPLIAERFGLERAAYVCTFAGHRSYTWPEEGQRPELPEDWVHLLTESEARIEERRAFIPVESGQGTPEGLLCLYRAPGSAFRAQDRDLLIALGRQMGIAAENLGALDNILRHSANLQAIFEGISDPLLLLDASGGLVMSNQAARDLHADLAGPDNATDGNLLPHLCAAHGGDCDLSRAVAETRFLSRETVREDGRSFLVSLYPVEGSAPDRHRVVAYVRETTSEKRMLEQVTRSEKLATVGKLSAGLAHEINNPLGVILCYAQLLKKARGLDEQQQADLDVIVRHTRQAQRVLRDLLNFARPKVSAEDSADLLQVTRQVAAIFSVQAEKRGVALHVDEPGDGPPPLVRGGAELLEHVVVNLVLNALDAAPAESGEVRLAVRAERAGERHEVLLTVEDNGPGIPEADLAHVFDPFFTTKEVNQGTGLGLTVVYGFMRDLGGRVLAENRAGGGARFEVRFPAAAEEEAA
jgi:signal transduction histidine kinase